MVQLFRKSEDTHDAVAEIFTDKFFKENNHVCLLCKCVYIIVKEFTYSVNRLSFTEKLSMLNHYKMPVQP